MIPKVSVIIVTHDGKEYIDACVRSVFESRYGEIEVIVVDNGSQDGTISLLKERYGTRDEFKLVALDRNYGPAYARNRGVEQARGKYLAFLDNDTKPDPDWLLEPARMMEEDSTIGACQCKLLLIDEPERIDYVGDYLSQFGFLAQRAAYRALDRGQFDESVEIFSAKSAGMLMRKESFDKAGGFDPDYFIYVEETDLAWRVWLAGYRVVFAPNSKVFHKFGTSGEILGRERQNFLVRCYGSRNYLATLFKNLGFLNLLKILPVHFFLWVSTAFLLILGGDFRSGGAIFKGLAGFVLRLGDLYKKRRRIQRERVVSDRELLPRIMRRKPLSYFYRKWRGRDDDVSSS